MGRPICKGPNCLGASNDRVDETGYCSAICELEHRNQCQQLIEDLSDAGFMDLDCSDLQDADAKILEEIGEEL